MKIFSLRLDQVLYQLIDDYQRALSAQTRVDISKHDAILSLIKRGLAATEALHLPPQNQPL